MSDGITKKGCGPEHGPTTWRCKCGAKKSMPAFILPKGWMVLTMRIGTGELLDRKEEHTYCESCAFAQRNASTMAEARRLLGSGTKKLGSR